MLVMFENQAEVAKEFCVSQQVVAQLVHKARKNKDYLRAILEKREDIESTRKVI